MIIIRKQVDKWANQVGWKQTTTSPLSLQCIEQPASRFKQRKRKEAIILRKEPFRAWKNAQNCRSKMGFGISNKSIPNVRQACTANFTTVGIAQIEPQTLADRKVYHKVNFVKKVEGSLIPLLWWVGCVDLRQNTSRQRTHTVTIMPRASYVAGLAVTSYSCFALRLELRLYFTRSFESTISLSIGCSLGFSRVIDWDAESVVLSGRGDVETMKMRITANEVKPSDVLPNGSTLLHVCYPFIL